MSVKPGPTVEAKHAADAHGPLLHGSPTCARLRLSRWDWPVGRPQPPALGVGQQGQRVGMQLRPHAVIAAAAVSKYGGAGQICGVCKTGCREGQDGRVCEWRCGARPEGEQGTHAAGAAALLALPSHLSLNPTRPSCLPLSPAARVAGGRMQGCVSCSRARLLRRGSRSLHPGCSRTCCTRRASYLPGRLQGSLQYDTHSVQPSILWH